VTATSRQTGFDREFWPELLAELLGVEVGLVELSTCEESLIASVMASRSRLGPMDVVERGPSQWHHFPIWGSIQAIVRGYYDGNIEYGTAGYITL
jgi:hypothetical protein